jgi:hypothetical protein
MGAGGLPLQGGRPALPMEGMDHRADRLVAASDRGGERARPFFTGAGQEDLSAAEDEGVGRAQGGLQRLALRVRQGPDVQRLGTHAAPYHTRQTKPAEPALAPIPLNL